VNTASRMESNGMPMQIQISDATAALLRDKNKGHWLSPRADKVVAKGKGEMQTFWLTAQADTHRTKSSSHGSSTNMDTETEDLHEALEAVEQRLRNMGRLDEEISMASGHGDAAAQEPDAVSAALQTALAKRVPSGRSFAAERVDV
jgi:Adenylate and Guanylate cyclase catalytic domain